MSRKNSVQPVETIVKAFDGFFLPRGCVMVNREIEMIELVFRKRTRLATGKKF